MGYSSVQATLNLIKFAYNDGIYDRYVLLQGLDYPIVSNDEINRFFIVNKDTEFIRGCNITNSKEKYFYSKCKYYWFFDNITILKRIANRISQKLNLRIRKGYVLSNNVKYDLYWGAAQWALTSECIKYIIEFSEKEEAFNKYCRNVFPADEIYFSSIVFNSPYSRKTTAKGPEKEQIGLINWRNLHYFEYPGKIKVFAESDYDFLKERSELFIRKTTTLQSSELLDIIDKYTK